MRNKEETETVIGIEIIMEILKEPAIEDNWSNDLRLGIKRYRSIKYCLQFCDNKRRAITRS